MDDFVEVQVVHATGNARGPVHQQPRGDLPASPQDLVELPVGTVLHDDAVARGLRADSPVKENTQWGAADRQLDRKGDHPFVLDTA